MPILLFIIVAAAAAVAVPLVRQARAGRFQAFYDSIGTSSSTEPAAGQGSAWDSLLAIPTAAADLVEQIGTTVQRAFTPPPTAAPYLDTIKAAEAQQGLPAGLLARVLYQESRFRPDVIHGGPNSAGAVGIAQIVPKWHPGVDATDPYASIQYAAGYLKDLYNQFGSWTLALAAYNWGPGNVSKYGLSKAPTETRNYVAQISADVPTIGA